jgi:NAD(P)-dependent dehydrogenase (short-subunit alcohol dehydrogenase family)
MGMLEGKVGIITGATSGIDARTAELFLAEGATVVFTGRRRREGEALAARLGEAARLVAVDAALEEDWARSSTRPRPSAVASTISSTMPAVRHRRAALPPFPSPASTRRWRSWCAR